MCKKVPKWRIGLTFSQYFMIDIEAISEEEAIEKALDGLESDEIWADCLQGHSKVITSVFINDREARDYSHFIPDGIDPSIEIVEDLTVENE